MPNLSQLYALKRTYYELAKADAQVQDYIQKSEAREVLTKAFSAGKLNENINETKLFSFITENLNPSKPEIIKYFDEARDEDVVLLFIDITSFSKTIAGWTNAKIKTYLDEYYKKIIPIIYTHGGEIEKLMGDGIICVFGKPFLAYENVEHVYKAEACAEEVIKAFYGGAKNVKVAIHKGSVTYYKVPGDHYGEYTMIGQPITDLYRLESISEPNAINFYGGSSYDELGWKWSRFKKASVHCTGHPIHKLQGVDFNRINFIMFPGFISTPV